MKTRPIIFQPWKAEWLHNLPLDYEAQTRRVVKCSNSFVNGHRCDKKYWGGLNLSRSGSNHGTYLQTLLRHSDDPSGENRIYKVCPRWQVGDRLWVRESFHFNKEVNYFPPSMVHSKNEVWYEGPLLILDSKKPDHKGKLRSPIHMPRWASRTLLEITAVKVERIQDISEKDARAEGAEHWDITTQCTDPKFYERRTTRAAYSDLWDKINGKKHPWAANDLVWVYTVRRVKE